ncbi:MAG: C40 family peptidase [Candidatus Calescibacterium sp.]|nr:C40 family peptidase [Candidatus Calescibacterium sp.]MDW8195289.1 C40 family peptidase [Candidatus Calescibacterium sp.]
MLGVQGIYFHACLNIHSKATYQIYFENLLPYDKINMSNLNNFSTLPVDLITGIMVGLSNGLLGSLMTSPLSIGFPQNNNQNINNQLLINLLFLLLILMISQRNNNPFSDSFIPSLNSPIGGISNTIPPISGFSTGIPLPSEISPFGFPNNKASSYLYPLSSTQRTQDVNEGNQKVVNLALQQVGKPYVYGAEGPNAFDCSGLVYWVFKKCGKILPRTADEQFKVGTPVSKNQLKPGDLVFFANTYTTGISHVGIYIGNGKFVHAANRRKGVIISSLSEEYYAKHYAGAKRIT